MDGIEIHNPYRLFGLFSAFRESRSVRSHLQVGGFLVDPYAAHPGDGEEDENADQKPSASIKTAEIRREEKAGVAALRSRVSEA